MPLRTVLLLCLSLAWPLTAVKIGSTMVSSRLRGGADGDDKPPLPEPRALSREEIMEKLNEVPVFGIHNSEGHMIGMHDADGSKASCCWFTDASEARALLEATSKKNPEAGLCLKVSGLGGAFTRCNGWEKEKKEEEDEFGLEDTLFSASEDEDETATQSTTAAGAPIELRLQGSHALVAEMKPKLEELLKEQGIDAGCWTLPVFLCNELQSRSIVPVFLHPADLTATWEKAGGDKDKMPEKITVMGTPHMHARMPS